MKRFSGILLFQAMKNAYFRPYDKFLRLRCLDIPAHALRGEDFISNTGDGRRAFRMYYNLRSRIKRPLRGNIFRQYLHVRRAITLPGNKLPTDLSRYIMGEILIRSKNYFIALTKSLPDDTLRIS